MALHSTKVGDRGALSVGMWTLTVLSLIVTTRSDCPWGMPCFAPEGGVVFNANAYGELRFECFSWECWDFVFDFPELLGFEFKLFADTGGVGVAFPSALFFPDTCLKTKVSKKCYNFTFLLRTVAYSVLMVKMFI